MTDDTALAEEILLCLRRRRQIATLSTREDGLSLERAYRISETVREARSRAWENPVGRKIGCTNRTIWDEYNVSAPIFGPMYDTTVFSLGPEPFDLSGLLEPRIEPEIAFASPLRLRPGWRRRT